MLSLGKRLPSNGVVIRVDGGHFHLEVTKRKGIWRKGKFSSRLV